MTLLKQHAERRRKLAQEAALREAAALEAIATPAHMDEDEHDLEDGLEHGDA